MEEEDIENQLGPHLSEMLKFTARKHTAPRPGVTVEYQSSSMHHWDAHIKELLNDQTRKMLDSWEEKLLLGGLEDGRAGGLTRYALKEAVNDLSELLHAVHQLQEVYREEDPPLMHNELELLLSHTMYAERLCLKLQSLRCLPT